MNQTPTITRPMINLGTLVTALLVAAACFTTTPAQAAANTGMAAGIGLTNATLTGTVNPGNLATAAWFQWGTSMNYGNTTAITNLPVTNTSLAVSNTLTGLVPGQRYFFRLVATNSGGLTTGGHGIFTTRSLYNLQLLGANPLTNELHAPFVDPGTVVWASPVGLAAGGNHSLAIKADGSVVAWGDNTYGQTNVPAGLTNVVALGAGYGHSMALRADGSIVAWGWNAYGQTNVPAAATNIVALAGGVGHSLALTARGTVLGWGYNFDGEVNVPAAATNLIAIAAGDFHSLALTASGTVLAWGDNSYGQTNIPASATNIVAIAAGGSHCMALTASGSVLAWGDNSYGQTNVPAAATGIVAIAAGYAHSLALKANGSVLAWGVDTSFNYGQTNVPAAATNVAAVAAGEDHSLALTTNGSVLAWGYDGNGQTDVPADVSQVNIPVAVTGAVDANTPGSYTLTYSCTNAVGMLISTNRTVVVFQTVLTNLTVVTAPATSIATNGATLNGTVYPNAQATAAWFQWGPTLAYGHSTAITNLTATNVSLTISTALTGLKPGQLYYFRVMAINTAGIIMGSPGMFITPSPYAIQLFGANPLTNAIHTLFTDPGATLWSAPVSLVSGGLAFHILTLKADGSVAAWGWNYYGQSSVPAAATNIVALAAGYGHSLALKADGSVVGWGNNMDDFGNYAGQGSAPAGVSNVVGLAAGYEHSLAIRADGSVVGWGWNGYGQTNVPAAATNVIAVAAGYAHSLALRADGTIIAWGTNGFGLTSVPAAATNVTAIAAGYAHSLALRTDGSVVAWGWNGYGQTNVPAAATNVIAVAAGYAHSLALRADGTIVAWGTNSYGQLSVPASVSNIVAITAGYADTFAQKADGTIAAWGFNADGETNVPANINFLSAPVFVSGGVDTNTAGTYILTYTYTNSLGKVASASRTVVVGSTTPFLANLAVVSGNISFTLSGTSGQTVVVETCTNINTAVRVWVPVQTNTLGGSPVTFSAPVQKQQPTRFYRLHSL